jgi:hypothetical protein
MQLKEIQRYKISVSRIDCATKIAALASGVLIFTLWEGHNVIAKTTVYSQIKKIVFDDAGSSPMPADFHPLEDQAIDLKPYFRRVLRVGVEPELVILDAAYQFVLTKHAVNYDHPSVETDNYDIVLRASSDIPIGHNPSSRSTSVAGGRTKPLRRKTGHRVWI